MTKLKCLLIVLIFVFTVGCSAGCSLRYSSAQVKDPFDVFSKEEVNQEPFFAILPCDEGMLFGYAFSKDVTDIQAFYMMSSHLEAARHNSIDMTNQVHIIIFVGPEKTSIITADFLQNEIEYLEEWNGKYKYRLRTWARDPNTVIDYLAAGFTGEYTQKKGRQLETPKTEPKPCPENKQGV